MKKRLNLNSANFLEIDLMENGDMSLEVVKKGLDGESKTYLDIPNPTTGGGDLESYLLVKELYDKIKI